MSKLKRYFEEVINLGGLLDYADLSARLDFIDKLIKLIGKELLVLWSMEEDEAKQLPEEMVVVLEVLADIVSSSEESKKMLVDTGLPSVEKFANYFDRTGECVEVAIPLDDDEDESNTEEEVNEEHKTKKKPTLKGMGKVLNLDEYK